MSLARRLGRRAPSPAKRLVRRLMAGRPKPLDTTAFGAFTRDDGTELELWASYRDAIKNWRTFYWPTALLVELAGRGVLPQRLSAIYDELLRSRSLPVPLADLVDVVASLHDELPDHVTRGAVDRTFGSPRLVPRPTGKQVEAWRASYRASADAILVEFGRRGVQPSGVKLLELGTATGYLSFAVAAASGGEVHGIDVELDERGTELERRAVFDALGASERVRLVVADAGALPYEDGFFDGAFSVSALEHMQDLPGVLTELHRVLRPGGVAVHVIDPWFSPQGGHSACTLDAPWGHVRLSDSELRRYFRESRPHEADVAIEFLHTGFQRPPRSLTELRTLVETTGFTVLSWDERRDRYRNHESLIGTALLEEISVRRPGVLRRDLLTSSVRIVMARR